MQNENKIPVLYELWMKSKGEITGYFWSQTLMVYHVPAEGVRLDMQIFSFNVERVTQNLMNTNVGAVDKVRASLNASEALDEHDIEELEKILWANHWTKKKEEPRLFFGD